LNPKILMVEDNLGMYWLDLNRRVPAHVR